MSTSQMDQAAEILATAQALQAMPHVREILDAERARKQARADTLRTVIANLMAEAERVSTEAQPEIQKAEARASELQSQFLTAQATAEKLKSEAQVRRSSVLASKPALMNERRILLGQLEERQKPVEESLVALANTAAPSFPRMEDDRYKIRPNPFG